MLKTLQSPPSRPAAAPAPSLPTPKQLLNSVLRFPPQRVLHCANFCTPLPYKKNLCKDTFFFLDTTTMLQREMEGHQLSASSKGEKQKRKKKTKKQKTVSYQTWHLRPYQHQATCNNSKEFKKQKQYVFNYMHKYSWKPLNWNILDFSQLKRLNGSTSLHFKSPFICF